MGKKDKEKDIDNPLIDAGPRKKVLGQLGAASKENFDKDKYLGEVLVFDVLGLDDVTTKAGQLLHAIKVHVYVATKNQGKTALPEPLEFKDVALFGQVMIAQLRDRIGEYTAGILTVGAKQPGKNPPYLLERLTDEQNEVAQAALDTI